MGLLVGFKVGTLFRVHYALPYRLCLLENGNKMEEKSQKNYVMVLIVGFKVGTFSVSSVCFQMWKSSSFPIKNNNKIDDN